MYWYFFACSSSYLVINMPIIIEVFVFIGFMYEVKLCCYIIIAIINISMVDIIIVILIIIN
jgi:hypothetical protein